MDNPQGISQSNTPAEFETADIEASAWLQARGHRLIACRVRDERAYFVFACNPAIAYQELESYVLGTAVCGRDLLEARRSIKNLSYRSLQIAERRQGAR